MTAPAVADMSSGYESLLLNNSSIVNATNILDSSRENNEQTGMGIASPSVVHSSADWSTPVRPEKPKRRWLREALTTSNEQNNSTANQTRPSVIMHACQPVSPHTFEPRNTSTPAKPSGLTRAMLNAEKQWTGAIALMQLASSTHG